MYVLTGLLVLCVCSSALASGGVDETMREKATGPEVVEATLDRLWGSCAFPNDKLYLRRIAKVEANDGQASHTFTQNGKDFYGGIWQVTDQMYRNTLSLTSYFDAIEKDFGIKWANSQWKDLLKPLYSAIAARLFIQSTLASGTEIPYSVSQQGRHWATDYHPGGDEAAFAAAANHLAGVSECENDQSDIVIVLDGSGSIGELNFEVARAFARNVSIGFNIGSDNTRIGLVQYSTNAKVEFNLGKHASKSQVADAINAMKYQKGNTNSADALKTMQAQFSQHGRSSTKGIPRVGIFMTDGKSNDKTKKKKVPTATLR